LQSAKVFHQSFSDSQKFFLSLSHPQRKKTQRVKCNVRAKVQKQKQKSQSKAKAKIPLCTLLKLSENSFCKKSVKSQSFHHHPHIIIISCFQPSPSPSGKISPPPWVGMTMHYKGKEKLQLICEAVVIRRGGVSGPIPAFFPSNHNDF
jgi:hypothetical protein